MWSIDQNNSWEDLHIFLPKAKIASISVSVNLMPPSKTPPISPTGYYSEPYQLDFKTWAKEIANLSLRYSNLTGYAIDNLQENLKLGYINQSYLDGILATGKSINPKLQFINVGPAKLYHIFYVDRDASGDGSGSDWTNASKTLAGLTWANIQGGDTVYVSGGTDSTTYPPVSLWQKGFNSQVVVTKGKDAGHNGDVVFRNTSTSLSYTFKMGSCRNIKLTGLVFTTLVTTDDSTVISSIIRSDNGNNITIDNCTITSTGRGTGIYLYGDTNTIVTNNDIEVLANSYISEADGIHIDDCESGYTITGNTIINKADHSTYAHKDCIQIAHVGGTTERPLITIANNLIMAINYNATMNTGLNVTNGYASSYLIYNNIILVRTQGNLGIAFQKNTYFSSARIFNNTILVPGHGQDLQLSDLDTLIMKNNILVMDTTGPYENLLFSNLSNTGYSHLTYKDIDYNLYYKEGVAVIDTGLNGSGLSLTQWQALGNDANGSDNIPIFSNKWGTKILDYKLTSGSAGIDEGIDLSSFFTTDILGIKRPLGTVWTIGAVESK